MLTARYWSKLHWENLKLLARKRATYDQFGEEGLKNGVPTGSVESGAWTHGYTFHGNPEKVFREFFGGDNPFQGSTDSHKSLR